MASNSDPLSVLRTHVKKSYAKYNFREEWRNLPEVPTADEILEDVRWDDPNAPEEPLDYQRSENFDPRLPHNKIDGPWESKEEYLDFQYKILREDAIAPLRQAVAAFKNDIQMYDSQDICVYTDIHFVGLQLSHLGPACRIEFSCNRAGKRIRWEQSSRLRQGSLVALSPSSDKFATVCKVAIVAARPIEGGLDCDPPMIDLFWGDYERVPLNPAESYIMIQSRLGLFEATRHVLVSLQKLATENTPFIQKYFIDIDRDITPPDNLKEKRNLDLRCIARSDFEQPLTDEEEDELCSVDVLSQFPNLPKSGMDESQLAACERMLTNSLAIVQGPPGTGKTFTSVQTLKALVSNTNPWDGPIIVAAQTNHALDQLLSHISAFESNFVRLGGRYDKNNDTISDRAIFELRRSTKDLPPTFHRGIRSAASEHEKLVSEIVKLLEPVTDHDLLTAKALKESGVMTEDHYESFFESGWSSSADAKDENYEPLIAWIGDQTMRMPRAPVVDNGLELEDPDQEEEELQETEAEGQMGEDKEGLSGTWVSFRRAFTGNVAPGRRNAGKSDPKRILKKAESLFDIPEHHRGAIYRYWETEYYNWLSVKYGALMVGYQNKMEELKIARWQRDAKVIEHLNTKVIGCTATGLSKYRGLLAALNPTVLLIEEAAETLEANVAASILPTLQQLILVGDHRQLQATMTLDRFEQAPYHMGISLFERLVNNGMGYTMLNKQRRMIPEIRELLCIEPNPFYVDLYDHSSVLDREYNRPPIPGMGGTDTFFFSHNWEERKDINMSCYNPREAEMVAGFFNYLVLNGIDASKITVLTFYNGQRKLLLKELFKRVASCTKFKVFTVDAYQGEENEVILLSLVRGNKFNNVGFLRSKNRVVVALSRAQRGLYFFGNAKSIAGEEGTQDSERAREGLWLPIFLHLLNEAKYGSKMTLVCSNHRLYTQVDSPEDLEELDGGCYEPCGGTLPCGHLCAYKCHPVGHDRVICKEPCPRILECGHGCSNECGQTCRCDECRRNMASPSSAARLDDPRNGLNHESLDDVLDAHDGRSDSPPKNTHLSSNDTPQAASRFAWKTFTAAQSDRPLQAVGHLAWKNFDAAQADKEIDKARLEREALPKVKEADLVYKETWFPTTTTPDGRRVRDTSGPVRSIIPRVIHDSNHTNPASEETTATPNAPLQNSPDPNHSPATCIIQENENIEPALEEPTNGLADLLISFDNEAIAQPVLEKSQIVPGGSLLDLTDTDLDFLENL